MILMYEASGLGAFFILLQGRVAEESLCRGKPLFVSTRLIIE